ncbi:hypothetical protein [Martelella alba]|nr:hypothetical protein [Martelella alba]
MHTHQRVAGAAGDIPAADVRRRGAYYSYSAAVGLAAGTASR